MLTLDQIRKRLEPMNIKAVAEETNLHPNAIYRLQKGVTNPSYETVKRLSDFLEALAR